MLLEEQEKKKKQLEENYLQETTQLKNSQKRVDEELDQFKKESSQLIDKVLYLTKNDSWDKQAFYRSMEQSQAIIQTESKRFSQKLEEKQVELKRTYQRGVEKIEQDKLLEKRKSDSE